MVHVVPRPIGIPGVWAITDSTIRPSLYPMSSVTNFPEQDAGGGDGEGLPTYENLAQEHGPNSRYDRLGSTHGHGVQSSCHTGSAGGKAG